MVVVCAVLLIFTGYPELFAVIGANVPDYRGYFLRGLGGNSAELGVEQGDAMRNFEADFNSFSHAQYYYNGCITRELNYGSAIQGGGNREYVYAGWKFRPSMQVPTSNENRPVNMAVRYLIRAIP